MRCRLRSMPSTKSPLSDEKLSELMFSRRWRILRAEQVSISVFTVISD